MKSYVTCKLRSFNPIVDCPVLRVSNYSFTCSSMTSNLKSFSCLPQLILYDPRTSHRNNIKERECGKKK